MLSTLGTTCIGSQLEYSKYYQKNFTKTDAVTLKIF